MSGQMTSDAQISRLQVIWMHCQLCKGLLLHVLLNDLFNCVNNSLRTKHTSSHSVAYLPNEQ